MLTKKVAGEMGKKKAMDLMDMKMIKSSIKCADKDDSLFFIS